jgi:cytochrome oxidase Cu insertion factor (SCO1/SenC/PrrC family)
MTRAALLVALVTAAAHPVAAREAPGTVDPAEAAYTYAVGPFAPEYTPPAPGSYALPVVDTIGDHPLLDVEGRRTTLYAALGDRPAVVAFVYTTCVEAAGCPVSMTVLQRVDRALADDAGLARRIALLTISFDPERDTPARMARVRALHRPRADWRFLTTSGARTLDPLLDDFNQPVARLRFPDGRWTGLFRHVLKVFLLDAEHRVRNVYSTGFLHPELVLNDIRTLLLEPAG